MGSLVARMRANERWRRRHPDKLAQQRRDYLDYLWLVRRENPRVVALVARLVAACGFRQRER